ncbi:MAG TPA: zinc-binding dehydrogenase [Pirellulales bacterium]|jgi:alcohol dehydrogenase|nr:zinc-binding dehydrogenase [Pirellulales bacterium]
MQMAQTSLAAVFHGPDQRFELRRLPLPELAAGELLVRIGLCTLCGSDLHTWQGKRSALVPTILGHEIMGEIAAIGPGPTIHDRRGQVLEVGQRITWSIAASCGECFFCTRDLPQKCERLFKYGHEELTAEGGLSGGLAEHCHLRSGTTVLVLPATLPDEVACLANCAAATVAGGFRLAGQTSGQRVLIFGAGMLGLIAAATAASRGATEIYITDVNADRLATAMRFGATAAITFVEPQQMVGEIMQRTEGRGVDVALELAGSAEAMEAAVQSLRIGGRAVLIGAVRPSRPLAIDGEQIVRRMLSICGLHNYGPDDLVAAIDFLERASQSYPIAGLVERRFSLADVDEAFRYATTNGALRVAVQP